MKINQAKQILGQWATKTDLPPIVLVGATGIGKTQIVTDIARSLNKHVEVLRVGSLDSPGDLLGLPIIEKGVTKQSKVEIFENLKDGGILFIDELNRCKPVLMDSIMQILDQKKLAGTDLSHCTIICAMNPDTDDYNVTDIDNAAIDRCLFIKVNNTVEDIASYFDDTKLDARVSELTLISESHLKVSCEFDLPTKKITPRGLRQLGEILPIIDKLDNNLQLELINACIGSNGVTMWNNKKILQEIPTAIDYLSNRAKIDVSDMEPLLKRILLRRINNLLKTEGISKESLTKKILPFGKTSLGYIMRNLSYINEKLDKSNKTLLKVAKEIMEVI